MGKKTILATIACVLLACTAGATPVRAQNSAPIVWTPEHVSGYHFACLPSPVQMKFVARDNTTSYPTYTLFVDGSAFRTGTWISDVTTTVSWGTTEIPEGTHEMLLVANDGLGLSGSTTYTLDVWAQVVPGYSGYLVCIAVMLAVAVLAMTVRKKCRH